MEPRQGFRTPSTKTSLKILNKIDNGMDDAKPAVEGEKAVAPPT